MAGSGPVSSGVSFTSITSLFGDLVSGSVLAITGGPSAVIQDVFRVNLYNTSSQPVTLSGLAGGRPIPGSSTSPTGLPASSSSRPGTSTG